MNRWNVANLCILGDNARPTLLSVCLLNGVLHVLQRVLKNPDAHSLHMLAISLPRTTSGACCPAIKISWAGSRPQSHNTYYLVKEECILYFIHRQTETTAWLIDAVEKFHRPKITFYQRNSVKIVILCDKTQHYTPLIATWKELS